MQDVPATLSNTRSVAFALWWKVVLVMGIWLFVSRFALGFLDFVMPAGQLKFWFATLIMNVAGERVADFLWPLPGTTGVASHVLAVVVSSVLDLTLLLLMLNWLLARHVGREFGGVRLVLQRGE